jgi:hypothetical protein
LDRNRWAATVAPVDHAFMPVLIKLFLKVCGQAFFEKGCDHADRVWG